MPKVRQYKDGKGYYIRSSFEGFITTYQVTPEGVRYFVKKGIGEGSILSVNDLLWMKSRGYLFTGGTGPGEIDPGIPLYRAKPKKKRGKGQSGCCCFSTIAIASLIPATILLGTLLIYNRSEKIM
jgi:hypothetical protein